MTHLHDRVSALVDGELTGPARSRALRHVQRCATCREQVGATLSVKQRLSALTPVDPPADLLAVLDSADPQIWPPAVPDGVTPHAVMAQRLLVGVGAMSVALLVLAWYVGAPATPNQKKVTPAIAGFTAEFAQSAERTALSAPVSVAPSEPSHPAAFDQDATSDRPPRLTPPARESTAASRARAVALLRQAVQAPQKVAFSGVREVWTSRGDHGMTLRTQVRHVPGQGTAIDVTGSGADTAAFVHPNSHRVNAAARAALGILTDGYRLQVAGRGEVLGRQATVVAAAHAGQVRARFWLDDLTGLVLRRQLLDNGQVVRSSGFVNLVVARTGFLDHLPPLPPSLPGQSLPLQMAPALNDTGWACPEHLVDGFRLLSLRRVDTDRAHTVRAVYSDGLSNVSVFEEPGRLNTDALTGFARQQYDGSPVYVDPGLPTVMVWQSGTTVLTVVTDAPTKTAWKILKALPHQQTPNGDGGVTSRVGRGLTTMVSKVSP